MHYLWVTFFIGISSVVFSERPDLVKEAIIIANRVYGKCRLTAVVWRHCDQEYVNDFVKNFEGTVVTIAIKEDVAVNNTELHKAVLYKQTVFFAQDSAEFEDFLKLIKVVMVVPIRIIVVITNEDMFTDRYYTEFTKIAWEQDVSDIILMGRQPDKAIALKTYTPYSDGICGNFKPVELKTHTTNYFRPKFRNFYGCPIRVSTLEFMPYVKVLKLRDTAKVIGGIDGNVLNLIFETLNASMDVVSADHTSIGTWANGTRTGTFGDLVNGIADIMVPSIIMTSSRHRVSQISYAYKMVSVAWYLPNRREILEWARVLLPFLNFSTPIILLAFLIILAILKLVQKLENGKFQSSKVSVIFAMFGIFFGQEIKLYRQHWFVTSLFTLWIWFCMIVRISYQGNLVDGLQKVILEPPIRTLFEAAEVVEEIGGVSTFLEFYRNTTVESKYKPIEIKQIPNYLKEIAAGKRFLLAADMLHVIYYRQELQMLDERVTSMPSCIHMRPRWPAAPEVASLISRFMETGLIEKMWRNLVTDWCLEHNGEDEGLLSFKPLGLKALSSCFYGLILMSFICLIVFGVEIILGQRRKTLKSLRTTTIK